MNKSNDWSIKYLWLIIVVVLANASGLFSSMLNSNDAYFYAILSKNIVTDHNWLYLFYNGVDWLDKPHLPFWITALSFEIFGVNAFAYVLPGFLLHLFGAIYTYRLAKQFFNKRTALVALIIYVSSLHLMLSAMDVRAEAYLLGEIIPACFYLWRYDHESRTKHLILTGFFVGLALMTKGLFVVITIFSGQIFYWYYTSQLRKLFSKQSLLVVCLSFMFALPEFICLYLQFDLHPEKIVFGTTGVSGIAWYFWGSQFGRFFNTGPIVNKHGDPFFFVHTLLWAFLPWSLVFLFSIVTIGKQFKTYLSDERSKLIYLIGAFVPTFVLFSATKFQLDHYTNIIMPFAAIWCAFVVVKYSSSKLLINIQTYLSVLLLVLNVVLIFLLFKFSWYVCLAILPIMLLIALFKFSHKISSLNKLVTFPALAISSVFILIMLVNGVLYKQVNAGYNLAEYLNHKPSLTVYTVDTDKTANNLELYSDVNLHEISNSQQITDEPYYLLINENKLAEFESIVSKPNAELVLELNNVAMEKFVPTLLSSAKQKQSTQHFKLYKVD